MRALSVSSVSSGFIEHFFVQVFPLYQALYQSNESSFRFQYPRHPAHPETHAPPGYLGRSDGCTLRMRPCRCCTNHGDSRNIQPIQAMITFCNLQSALFARSSMALCNARSYSSLSCPFSRSTTFTGIPADFALHTSAIFPVGNETETVCLQCSSLHRVHDPLERSAAR